MGAMLQTEAGDGWSTALMVAAMVTPLVCCILLYRAASAARGRRLLSKRGLRLPPGPAMALPLIGHLHYLLIGPHAYKSLHKLSQRYGPIMYLRLGSSPTVVISSPSLAKRVLHDHDEALSFRPAMEAAELMFYNHGIGPMQPDDPLWKDLRRIFARELLSPKALLSSKYVRDEEVGVLLQQVRRKAGAGECVEVRSLASGWIFNVMIRLLLSGRVDCIVSDQIADVLKELADLFAQPLLGEMVPCLQWFDPRQLRKQMKLHTKRMDALLQAVLNQRLQQRHSAAHAAAADHPKITAVSAPADLLSALLDYFDITPATSDIDHSPFDQCRPVKGIILDALVASSDTTSTTVEWAMLELLRGSGAKMARLQEEVRAAVHGPGQQVEEGHVLKSNSQLPYLQAVVKETFRLHPPAPLLLPHLTREPIEICGYSLPSETRFLMNVWAMGRDESLWEAAHQFRPERFLEGGHANEVSGQTISHQMLMSFGLGRRGCPGQTLGITMVSLLLANLVHSFDWQPALLTSSPAHDDGEAAGRFLGRLAKPFAAKPSIRSRCPQAQPPIL